MNKRSTAAVYTTINIYVIIIFTIYQNGLEEMQSIPGKLDWKGLLHMSSSELLLDTAKVMCRMEYDKDNIEDVYMAIVEQMYVKTSFENFLKNFEVSK